MSFLRLIYSLVSLFRGLARHFSTFFEIVFGYLLWILLNINTAIFLWTLLQLWFWFLYEFMLFCIWRIFISRFTQRRIQNTVKHLRWSVYVFPQTLHFRCLTGFLCASVTDGKSFLKHKIDVNLFWITFCLYSNNLFSSSACHYEHFLWTIFYQEKVLNKTLQSYWHVLISFSWWQNLNVSFIWDLCPHALKTFPSIFQLCLRESKKSSCTLYLTSNNSIINNTKKEENTSELFSFTCTNFWDIQKFWLLAELNFAKWLYFIKMTITASFV